MVSTNSKLGKAKQKNSFEKLDENVSLKAEDMSWLIDNLPVTVFRSSSKLSWGIDYISSSVEKLTGYSKKDFIDQKILWSDIVFPEDVKIMEEAIKVAKKNPSPYQIEYRIKRADGSTVFIQEQAHVVFDGKGEPSYIAGVFSALSAEVKQKTDSHGSVKEEETIQLEMFRSFVDNLSRGEIPELITDNYNNDLEKIKNNINNCIEGLQGLVECNNVLNRMAVNDHTKSVEGEFVGIYASMAEATNLVRDRVLNVTNVLENIAIGNTSRLEELKKIRRRSEQDRLMPAIIGAMENVHLLIEDTEMLTRAGIEGKLDIRADASRHKGEFRKVVEGVNDILDAVIGPLNVAAEYVERISRGDIPQKINDNYNGDFNEIKNNLNNCIDGLQGLVECNHILQRMAVNDLTKGVEGKYVGIFASMGEAINLVQTRVLNVTNVHIAARAYVSVGWHTLFPHSGGDVKLLMRIRMLVAG